MIQKVLRQDSISENAKAMFTSIDPHAESYYQLSPYSYCGGNPVNRIDPTGMDWYQNNKTSYYILVVIDMMVIQVEMDDI